MEPQRLQLYLDAFADLSAGEQEESLRHVAERFHLGDLDQILLQFSSRCLMITVDSDTDEIVLNLTATTTPILEGFVFVDQSPIWAPFIGKLFGWGWVTINQQGYCDGLMLSFGNIRPAVLVYAIASSLRAQRLPAGPA